MMMKKMIRKLINFLFPSKYSLVYRTLDGRTEMYSITAPKHENEFGNYKEGLAVAGFRAHCFNRDAVRSFRYDRIISLVKS